MAEASVRAELEEKNERQKEAREQQKRVESEIADCMEEAGFPVATVDATSEYPEFSVTIERMLDREELQEGLDEVFENFEYASVSAVDDELHVFFQLTET